MNALQRNDMAADAVLANDRMVEVSWQRQRYAVFELDLTTRAIPELTHDL
jgi:hypothetical protein